MKYISDAGQCFLVQFSELCEYVPTRYTYQPRVTEKSHTLYIYIIIC